MHSTPAQPWLLGCPEFTGSGRILELFFGHWDVVSLIGEWGHRKEDLTFTADMKMVQQIALCSAPLALHEFGLPPASP